MRLFGTAGPPPLAGGLLGAVLLLGADLVAQRLPVALPVGIVTAVVGAPYLLLPARCGMSGGQVSEPRTPSPSVADRSSRVGGAPVLAGRLSLSMPAGRVTTIIGPNGCGKSTLLRVLGRLLAPRPGRSCSTGDRSRPCAPRESPASSRCCRRTRWRRKG